MYIVTLALELFVMTCVGVFALRAKIVSKEFSSQLTAFVMNICLPCLVFNSIVSEEYSEELLKNCVLVLVLAVGVCLVSLALGQIVYIASKKSGSGRVTRYGMTFPHFSFMGIPVMDALFGATGNLYYMVFLIPVRILYYGMTKQLLTPAGTEVEKLSRKEKIKNIFSPCLIVLILGIIFWVNGLKMPTVFSYCISSLAKLCSPLGLILCGLTLGKYDFKKLLNIRYFKLPIIRTLVMPAVFYGISRLLIAVNIDKTICDMIVVYSCLPIASMTAAFTIQYDPDTEVQFEAAGSTVFSTILCIATIPLWCALIS